MKPLDPRLLRDRTAVRPLIALAGVRAVVDAGIVVTQALLLAHAFADVVGGTADVASLRRTALLLFAVTGVQALLGWAMAVTSERAATRTTSHLRERLLSRVLEDGRTLPPGEIGVLATRGVDAMRPYLAGYVPQLVSAALLPPLLVAAIASQDRLSAAILLVTLPLVPLFMVLVGRFSQRQAAASWASVEHLAGHVHDVIVGMTTLKRFGRHRRQRDAIAALGDRSRRTTMTGLRTAFLSGFVLELAATLSVALVAVPLGIRLVDGTIDLATAFVVLLLTPMVFVPLRRVGAEYHTATEGVAATDRILGIVDAPRPPRGTRPLPTDLDVACADVDVRRPGRSGASPAGAGLHVGRGEVVALIGPNGVGKSTLLGVLRGVVEPDAGTVTIGGTPLADLDPDAWSDAVAWVPQRPVLTDDSVRANISMGAPDAAAGTTEEAARSLGIGHLLDRRARTLSAGEGQRVALARALLRVEAGQGRVALLDEPSANLDRDTEDAVVGVVRRLADHGAAVVVVAHRPALVAAADRVVVVRGSDAPAVADVDAGPRSQGTAAREGRPADVERPAAPTIEQSDRVPSGTGHRSALRWLGDEARPVRFRLAATAGLGVAATASGLALTVCASWLLSRASQQPDILSLGVVVVMVRGFALAKASLRYVERLGSHDTTFRLIGDLRARVVDRLAVITPGGLAHDRHGELLSRVLGDLDDVQDLWLRAILPPIANAITALGLVLAASFVLPSAGAVLAVGLLIGGVLVPWSSARLERRSRVRAAAERAALTGDVVDLTEAAEELAAYRAAPEVLARVVERDCRLGHHTRVEAWVGGLAEAVELALPAAVAGTLLVVAGGAAIDGGLAVLAVPSLVLLGWVLTDVVGALPTAARHLNDLAPAARRITEVLDAADPNPDPPRPHPAPTGPLGLTLDGVQLRWPGAAGPAVRAFDLAMAPGEVVVLTGPSGAGKSTLAAALVGFLAPAAGTIAVGGVDVTDLRGDDLRRLVGWCAQDSHLFDASLRDNLRIARPDADDDDLLDVLARVRLDRWVADLPHGLDTPVGTNGTQLSGGQAQRLALAQILLADPPVVVLDEPTANLDPDDAGPLIADLLDATRGRTTLAIMHALDGVPPGTRRVHLEATEVRADRPGPVGPTMARAGA